MSNTAFCSNGMVYLITHDFFECCTDIKMTSPLPNTVDVFEKVDVEISFVFILYSAALNPIRFLVWCLKFHIFKSRQQCSFPQY